MKTFRKKGKGISKKIVRISVVILALISLACPIVIRAVNYNPMKYTHDKKQKTKDLAEDDPVGKVMNDVKDKEKKAFEDNYKAQKTKEYEEEYQAYLSHVPFGDFIELKVKNDSKISVSLQSAKALSEDDERVVATKKEISDVSQLVEVSYIVYVAEGEFTYNASIFKFLDVNEDQGAVIMDYSDQGTTLKKGQDKLSTVLVAFKGNGDKLSAQIGNAVFKGTI
ncbi:hypothetical protein [Vagococcus hydrophili]|uniref:Uncharacterized protein n=1 Tax=Vagococcus hydrophili TaxID=2714947 RepID=A0A6G8AR63_9ENTE|nr:hypothetical protein [Vagococcus hydrophili]QIL47486.1 hypothetical protein G7082_02515 [Vagococcus hydrophili]